MECVCGTGIGMIFGTTIGTYQSERIMPWTDDIVLRAKTWFNENLSENFGDYKFNTDAEFKRDLAEAPTRDNTVTK